MIQKWFGCLILVMAIGVCVFAVNRIARPTPSATRVELTPKIFSVEAREGDTVSGTFVVRNPTNVPVRLLGVKASCGCLVVGGLPSIINAEASGTIQLAVHVGKPMRDNLFEQSFVLLSNTPDQLLTAEVRIKIKP